MENILSRVKVEKILSNVGPKKILVLGDVMLDHFIWGRVDRISPEAPVPVMEFQSESFMPGGAANVARNLSALGVTTSIVGVIGQDEFGLKLKKILADNGVDCGGIVAGRSRPTTIKTRLIAQHQQMVRLDREDRREIGRDVENKVLSLLDSQMPGTSACIFADYGKGMITDSILKRVKNISKKSGVWLSLDPKPLHALDLSGVSLLTPNRKEIFSLVDVPDVTPSKDPLLDKNLLLAARKVLKKFHPKILLITLGDQGMIMFEAERRKPVHISSVAREVYDVSGAGDTVIAVFTMAISSGATPLEAAVISNHAAGIVVGKVGTATCDSSELLASFN